MEGSEMKDKTVKMLLVVACVLLLLNLVKGSVAPVMFERPASAQIPSVIQEGKTYAFDGVSPYYKIISINNEGWAKVEGSDAPKYFYWVNLNLIKKVEPKERLQ
jgi:hypothetical protein